MKKGLSRRVVKEECEDAQSVVDEEKYEYED